MVVERTTDAVALAGATSYFWTSSINDNILVPVLTILGIVWLLVQIYYKIRDNSRKGYTKDEDTI